MFLRTAVHAVAGFPWWVLGYWGFGALPTQLCSCMLALLPAEDQHRQRVVLHSAVHYTGRCMGRLPLGSVWFHHTVLAWQVYARHGLDQVVRMHGVLVLGVS